METTYTVRVKKTDVAFEFKYNLNGEITAFKLIRGTLSEKQSNWLFTEKFPCTQQKMKQLWIQDKSIQKNFEIEVGELDLSFQTFFNEYKYKIKKVKAELAWNKLNQADKLEAIKGIEAYDGYLKRKRVAKANPEAYLNQRRWEDEFNSIH